MISLKRVGAAWFHVSIFKMLIKIILPWSKAAQEGQTGLRLPLEVTTWPTWFTEKKKHSNFICSRDWDNLLWRLGRSPQSSSPDQGGSPRLLGQAIPTQLEPQGGCKPRSLPPEFERQVPTKGFSTRCLGLLHFSSSRGDFDAVGTSLGSGKGRAWPQSGEAFESGRCQVGKTQGMSA